MPWTDPGERKEDRGPWEAPASRDPNAPDPSRPTAPRPDRLAPRLKALRQRLVLRPSTPTPSSATRLRALRDALARRKRVSPARIASQPARNCRGWAGVAAGAAAGLFAGWLASGLYVVDPGEVGAVTRLGAFAGIAAPGLHYHWPKPFGAVAAVSVRAVHRMELEPAPPVLTADGAALHLDGALRWRVRDPFHYLQAASRPTAALRLAAASALLQAAGGVSGPALLQPDHGGVSARAAAILQRLLDQERAGVEVLGFDLQPPQPPFAAADAVQGLALAGGAAARARDEAQAYRLRVLAEARADAARTVATSKGYADEEVAAARGEAARFALVDAQYRKAPAVTRERLYTETMQRLLHDIPKVVAPAGAPITVAPGGLPGAAGHGPSPARSDP